MIKNLVSVILLIVTSGLTLRAQTSVPPYQRGIVDNPCSQVIPQGHQLNLDFGQLCKYESLNAKLPVASDLRVVFFGDSITEFWGANLPNLNNQDVINRGISGQTTAQMLVRFRADVINLKPRVVHLMMGTNDIAGNTGATSFVRIQNAVSTMAELAKSKGIRVVIGSVLPAKIFTWRPEINPATSIQKINQWLMEYSAREGFVYADYYSVLKDEQGGFKSGLANDGVHPNQVGYNVMYPIAQAALQKAHQ